MELDPLVFPLVCFLVYLPVYLLDHLLMGAVDLLELDLKDFLLNRLILYLIISFDFIIFSLTRMSLYRLYFLTPK